MRWSRLLKLLFLFYLCFSLFVIYILYRNRGSNSSKSVLLNRKRHRNSTYPRKKRSKETVVIWSKAAIGLYLWQHIFEAPLERIRGDLEQFGEMQFDGINIKFRTGALLTPETVDVNTKNAVLVINGREKNKVSFAKTWLDSLSDVSSLKNLAVVLLGSEQCDNEWFKKYMTSEGGFVKLAFIVYDIPYIDNLRYFQWPLGVATYRKFPVIQNNMISKAKRKYICNFIGTIYKNSSRQELVNIINSHEDLKNYCFTHLRYDWLPNETEETRKIYNDALKNSDLTLCPVGVNTECYRIYEAMSYGSVPVIEDVMTPGQCGNSQRDKDKVPLRLLKQLNAPFIYIKSWHELHKVIAHEKTLSTHEVLERRAKILKWYQKFKYQLRNMFLNQISKGFDFQEE